jgi:hypothetical protein
MARFYVSKTFLNNTTKHFSREVKVNNFRLSNKRNGVLNMFTSAVVWCLWKLRNDLCFQRSTWKSMAILLFQVAVMAEKWKILYLVEKIISQKVKLFKEAAAQVLWLQWR